MKHPLEGYVAAIYVVGMVTGLSALRLWGLQYQLYRRVLNFTPTTKTPIVSPASFTGTDI